MSLTSYRSRALRFRPLGPLQFLFSNYGSACSATRLPSADIDSHAWGNVQRNFRRASAIGLPVALPALASRVGTGSGRRAGRTGAVITAASFPVATRRAAVTVAPSSVNRFVSAVVPIALPGCFVPCMPVIGVLGRCLSMAAPFFPSEGLIFSVLSVVSWAFAPGFCVGEEHGLEDAQSGEKGVGRRVRVPIPKLVALHRRFFCMRCVC